MADAILALHWAVVVFIVGGLGAILAGHRLGWRWTRTIGFRIAHLVAIATVVGESWLGVDCPLTVWEAGLRDGVPAAGEGFVARWMARLLYYDAPPWTFTVVYSLFGLAVVLAWRSAPPRRARD